MSDRLPCKSEGCSATILQSTANRTGGYCMPCHQKMEREAYEEFIKQNRKDVNLYEGITDFVDILKIMHTPKRYDPLKNYIKYEKSMEEVYNLLSKEELERLKYYALELIKNDELELAQNILTRVVCYRNEDVGACLRALIAKGECYPEVIFKDAPNDVRDYLINQINNDSETLNLNHILLALAWIGDKKVVELFSNWKNNPPKWIDKLYIAPEEYSLEAGWELTQNEKRNPYHSASQFLETTFSQIGGCPTWIQDAEYPKCPKCSQHMKFIAQFDWEDVENYGEGIYYAFICSDCNIAATHYQQS